ncbi:MAG: hypothetical protein EZS28_052386, partial [Streblomastix strix]
SQSLIPSIFAGIIVLECLKRDWKNKSELSRSQELIDQHSMIIREMNNGIAAGNNAIFNNAGINDDDCLDELQRHSTPYGWK